MLHGRSVEQETLQTRHGRIIDANGGHTGKRVNANVEDAKTGQREARPGLQLVKTVVSNGERLHKRSREGNGFHRFERIREDVHCRYFHEIDTQ